MNSANSQQKYAIDQHLLLKHDGTWDRRVVVVSAKLLPDGTYEYRVKAIDNGEDLKLIDGKNGLQQISNTVAKANQPTMAAPLPQPPTKLVLKDHSNDPLLKSGLARAPVPIPGIPQKNNEKTHLDSEKSLTEPRVTISTSVPIEKRIGTVDPAGTAHVTVPVRQPQMIVPAAGLVDPVPIMHQPPMTAVGKYREIEPVPIGFRMPVGGTVIQKQAHHESVVGLQNMIQQTLLPSVRERLLENLAEHPAAKSSEVRSFLMDLVMNDPAPNVRAGAIRGLRRIGVVDSSFRAMLVKAENDSEKIVQEEARKTISFYSPQSK
ncbi:MAG: HEAT repeat domain-containing protein [Zavarzinella sp.]